MRKSLSIIGCGWIFENGYLPHFLNEGRELFRIASVFDTDPVRMANAASVLSTVPAENIYDAINVADNVLICTPNKFHVKVTKLALEAGKSCLIEKPACVNSWEANQILQKAELNGVLAQVSTCCSLRTDVKWVLSRLDYIKPLRRISLTWRRRNGIPTKPWHIEENNKWSGVLPDIGFHLIDIAGAALKYETESLVVGQAISKREKVLSAASFYQKNCDLFCHASYDVEAYMSIAGVEVELSLAWAGEKFGDRTDIVIEGAGGFLRLSGLFGYSIDTVRKQVICEFKKKGDKYPIVECFPIGPSQHQQAFHSVLADFNGRSENLDIEKSHRQIKFSAEVIGAIQERI